MIKRLDRTEMGTTYTRTLADKINETVDHINADLDNKERILRKLNKSKQKWMTKVED